MSGIYETPAGAILMEAHIDIEVFTMDRVILLFSTINKSYIEHLIDKFGDTSSRLLHINRYLKKDVSISVEIQYEIQCVITVILTNTSGLFDCRWWTSFFFFLEKLIITSGKLKRMNGGLPHHTFGSASLLSSSEHIRISEETKKINKCLQLTILSISAATGFMNRAKELVHKLKEVCMLAAISSSPCKFMLS